MKFIILYCLIIIFQNYKYKFNNKNKQFIQLKHKLWRLERNIYNKNNKLRLKRNNNRRLFIQNILNFANKNNQIKNEIKFNDSINNLSDIEKRLFRINIEYKQINSDFNNKFYKVLNNFRYFFN